MRPGSILCRMLRSDKLDCENEHGSQLQRQKRGDISQLIYIELEAYEVN
jgi:hypothetical protein